MQTITTKVIPATNTKPTRIKAASSSGLSYIQSISKFDSTEDAHQHIAFALMQKLKWKGTMIGGHTEDGMVWVFANGPVIKIA